MQKIFACAYLADPPTNSDYPVAQPNTFVTFVDAGNTLAEVSCATGNDVSEIKQACDNHDLLLLSILKKLQNNLFGTSFVFKSQ